MTDVFLINRMLADAINYQTPLRMLSQFHFIHFALNLCPKVFGCVRYAHIHSHQRDNLDPRSLKCVFLGYFNSQKGYKCFHPPISKYYVSMDVQFCEWESYFFGNVSLIPLQGKISSKEEERLWLEEKRLWILGQEEDSIDLGKGESVDTLNPMTAKFASKERRDRRPAKLFQQGYTKKNKDATVIPSSRLPYS